MIQKPIAWLKVTGYTYSKGKEPNLITLDLQTFNQVT